MYKKTLTIIALIATLSLIVIPVLAIKPAGPSAKNGLEKGKIIHLYLYQKDPYDEWPISEDPAWAKIKINPITGKFVCNAHQLPPNTEYALICYKDPWPGEESDLLGTGISNEDGNVHIKDVLEYENLPVPEGGDGSKIWLVLAEDFEEDQMVDWNPTEYLFEYDLINIQED